MNKVKYKIAIVTVSDSAAAGLRNDKSGPFLCSYLKERLNCEYIKYLVISDDAAKIREVLCELTDKSNFDLVVTTGGTGLGPRDSTPDVTEEIIDKKVPGLPEAMRISTLKYTPYAMLSRACAGIRGKTLIINLPGSEKAVKECIQVILPVLSHALNDLRGEKGECPPE